MPRFLALAIVLSLVVNTAASSEPCGSAVISAGVEGSFSAAAMSLPLLGSWHSILSPKPVNSRLTSLRAIARLDRKDVLFLSSLVVILVGGLLLDFHYFDGWAVRHPQSILISFLPVSTLAALAADLGAQWIEIKVKEPHHFVLRQVNPRRVWNLIATGAIYSATVESLIYVSGLHALPISALWRALIDIALISPWVTDPLSYFVYANYVEGGGEQEAVAQIRENGTRVYVRAAPWWFLAMWWSMSRADPTLRFIGVSLGVVIWNLIFSLEAGEKSRPLPSLLNTLLRPIQAYYDRPWFGLMMRWQLKLFSVLVLVKQLVLLNFEWPAAASLAITLVSLTHFLNARDSSTAVVHAERPPLGMAA